MLHRPFEFTFLLWINEYETEKQFLELLNNPEAINSIIDSKEKDSKTETKESQHETEDNNKGSNGVMLAQCQQDFLCIR